MTTRTGIVCAALAVAAVLGCGGGEEEVRPENVENAVAEEVAAATGAAAASDVDPCAILDDALLRAHFDLPPDAEIVRAPSRVSPHPHCRASWPKGDAAEIEAGRAAAMSEYMQRKMKGENVAMPSFRTEDEVSLTVSRDEFETPVQARSAFDASMSALARGITGSHEQVEVTFQADMTPVSGVGEAAMWIPKMRQLSVVSGRRIFHVGVNRGGEAGADRETAVALARQIAARL